MSLKHYYSTQWDEYSILLRKYKLSSILQWTYKVSLQLFTDVKSNATKRVEISYLQEGSNIIRKQECIVMAWTLVDLAYHAIITTNNHRGKEIETTNEFYSLVMAENTYHQATDSKIINEIGGSTDFFSYLWGFGGEQFKFESLDKVKNNTVRDLYILFDIATKQGLSYVKQAIYDEMGMSWEKIYASLLLTWVGSLTCSTVDEIVAAVKWDRDYTESEYSSIIKKYTISRRTVIESDQKRQALYSAPFVEIDSSVYFINVYLSVFIYEHCALWIVRNHFAKMHSQKFTNDFGYLFEEYFCELLIKYLPNTQFEHISENNVDKRADWRVDICGYHFLIEQKSPMVRLSAKQQEPDIQAMNDYFKNTIVKALRQLYETEKEMKNGSYYKIVLLYEDYIHEGALAAVFSSPSCDIPYDNRYRLITIDDMERILSAIDSAPEKGKEILHRIFDDGRAILEVLSEMNMHENLYIRQSKFVKYEKEPIDFLCKHLPSEEIPSS